MNNRGFTLIEVLIAMLILAVGVLGVASLQMSTYRQLQMSNNAGKAAMLGGEMADRMLANRAEVLLNNYNHTSAPGSPPACDINPCTANQLAAYDIAIWQSQITSAGPGALPTGSGTVARVGGTDDFVITLRWDDDLSGSVGTNCASVPPDPNDAAVTAADLDCYRLTVGF